MDSVDPVFSNGPYFIKLIYKYQINFGDFFLKNLSLKKYTNKAIQKIMQILSRLFFNCY